MKLNNRAFTLLEVIAAFLILCIGFLGSLVLFHSGLKTNIQTQILNKMQFFAQETMENIKKGKFSELVFGETTFKPAASPYEDIMFKTVVDKPVLLGEPPDFNIKRITLTVRGFDGRTQVEKEFVDYIAE